MKKYHYLLIVASAFLTGCGDGIESGEVAGIVKYSDCRETVFVKEHDLRHVLKTYVCDYNKTNAGVIMSGTCVHVSLNNDGSCKRAYVYYKKQANVCDKDHPVLHYDDRCYTE